VKEGARQRFSISSRLTELNEMEDNLDALQ
jgi:hypothetical protein